MQEKSKDKRIVLISAFNMQHFSATDITLKSYFSVFDNNNLMVISSSPNIEDKKNVIEVDIAGKKRIKNFADRIISTIRSSKTSNRNIVPGAVIKTENQKQSIKELLITVAASFVDILGFGVNSEIMSRIDEFKPEAIYTTMGNIRIIKLANKLSARYKIPVYPHFMDDWINTLYTGSKLISIPRYILLKQLRKLFSNSIGGFCISEKMCREYKNRYGVDFIPLMNIVPEEKIMQEKKTNIKDKIVFSYFGGLHLNRWKTLKQLSSVLEKVTKDSGKQNKLILYTGLDDLNHYKNEFTSSVVEMPGPVEHDKIIAKMREADFLVHVESFDSSVITYTQHSISTKIPEYLASGVPVVAIGPGNLASIEYLKNNNCGIIIEDNSIEKMEYIIKQAIESGDIEKLSSKGLTLVLENHSKKALQKFRNYINGSKS